jgi:hypothetical protein
MLTNPLSPTNQTFTDFEKEALGELVLKSVQSDLQRYLDKFHVQQMKYLEAKMAGFEQKCARQIQASIEENVKLQLEAHFKEVVQACQKDISQATSPLFKRVEGDVQSLAHTVTKANEFCKDIQMKYALRWSTPFFTLVFSTVLTGVVMGFVLLFLQLPLVSVFLMNAHTREAYETGLSILNYRKELEAKANVLEAQPAPQEPAVQKAPPTPSKKKKKKGSK